MKNIILKNGMKIKVDDEDFDMMNKYKWYPKKIKHSRHIIYATTTSHIKGKSRIDKNRNRTFLMHRLIMGLKRGDGKMIDHRDGNGLNNQKENLRIATNQQNNWNRKYYKGYLGVSKCKDETSQWRVRAGNVQYGQYKDAKIAALVYDTVVRKKRGEFASLNFPDEFLPDDFLIPNFNSEPLRAEHRSGVSGVVWHKAKGKWRIIVKGKSRGYYNNLKEAIKTKRERDESKIN